MSIIKQSISSSSDDCLTRRNRYKFSRLAVMVFIAIVEVSCLNRKEGIIMGLVLLGTFVGGVYASNPASQLLNVFVTNFPQTSHLGQSTSDHVVLSCHTTTTSFALDCDRVLANGTRVGFSIPVDMVLVVTDISWAADTTDAPGTMELVHIFIKPSSGDSNAVFTTGATVSPNGFVAVQEHMTAGFVVSSTATMEASSTIFGSSVGLQLYGYLTRQT